MRCDPVRLALALALAAAAGCAGPSGRPAPASGPAAPPNLILIVIDTLRADHATPYGYARATTPEIQRLVADRGVVVETAWAQAPWTLPSAASYLTGRWPGDLLGGGGMASYGIPEDVTGLPEALAARGYATGGFIANPTLHAGNGFARGFDEFYAPPAVSASMLLHADELSRRAIPWLVANQRRRFFLYAHFLDPHDPYDNPDTAGGVSPFEDGYEGTISGRDVHALHAGQKVLADPEADVAHLTALYDGEIRYADRHVGRLLAALDPEVLADTLVVVTSDHGEELYERGGFKHGQTLYEEQIRVPLIVRWDRRLPAGTRLAGTAMLIDLVPTLLAAAAGAGEEPPGAAPGAPLRDLPGIDLLPALAGREPLPRRAAFAQHLAVGPPRAAAVLGASKLIRFDRAAPFTPANRFEERLARLDLERLAPVELYDLAADPGERANLAAAEPARAARLGAAIDRRLAGQDGRLTILAGAGAGGGRISGRLRFDRAPEGWMPYFLAPSDRVELSGRDLAFDLGGEPLGKGITVLGDPGGVEALEVAAGGRPAPPGRVLIGPGRPWAGGPVEASALALDGARGPGGPGADAESALLHLFRRGAAARAPAADDPETRRRLEALGYLR